MSLLKQLDRAARTAWCPSARYPSLLASGTIAGTIDDSFVTKSQLEIYELGLAHHANDMRLLGSIESKDCFHSIAWGSKGMEDGGAMSHGVVAGGMSDGSINLWNVDAILQRAPQEQALLSRSEVHKGQVLGLQFHPQQPNLLASGATDGEVYVWDLANLRAPVPNKPSNAKSAHLSGITSLAWNRSAPQILASASEVGETTVWDLRQKRSIITIRNSARMNVRASGLAWNPAAGTQLAVCYSNYPVTEIWDLRQSMTPKLKLEGVHSGSILSLDWCPNDPSVLMTVGEDARMASWNPLTGALLHEYTTSGQVAFDVKWSPKQPNLLSTSSYDGKVNVLSIDTTGPSHVPAWMTKPVGTAFGFGGKLVSFGLDKPAAAATPTAAGPTSPHKPAASVAPLPTVQIQQLVTDPDVLDKAAGLQQILQQGDFPTFCSEKIVAAGSDEDEKTIWTFMKILFEDGANQRYLLLKELGFEPPASSDIAVPEPAAPVPVPDAVEPVQPVQPVEPTTHTMSEEDFFAQEFPAPPEEAAAQSALDANGDLAAAIDGIDDTKEADAKDDSANGAVASASTPAAAAQPFVEDADDREIRQALVFGDFKAAVTKCLAVGRMADAIIFASFGPPPLWEETRAQYFASHRMPFIRDTMKNVSNQSLEEMIDQSQLDRWKETLAICITYTTTQKYRELVNQLADRLESANRPIPAVVCYICSSNIDKAIDMWTRKIPAHVDAGASGSALLALHSAIEKIAVFAHATNAHAQPAVSEPLSAKYAEYAQMLASQGDLRGAFNYLSRVATPNDPNSSVLLDRIYHAEGEQFARDQYPVPPFPFPTERVDTDPTLAQTLQAQQVMKQQKQAMLAQQQAMQAASRAQAGQPQFQTQTPVMQPPQQAQQQQQMQYGQNGVQHHFMQQHQQPQSQPQPVRQQPMPTQQQYHQYGQPQPIPPQQQQQPRTFQPQQPAYNQPPVQHQPQMPAAHAYGQQAYGQPAQIQPPAPTQYGVPQPQQAFNQPPHAQPAQRAPVPPQGHATQQGAYNQPPMPAQAPLPTPTQQPQSHYGQPTHFMPPPTQQAPVQPQPTPFVPAPQPQPIQSQQPFVPAASPYGAPAPAPVQPAAAPKPFTPTVPAAAPAPVVTAPAAAPVDAPVALSPVDQSVLSSLERCLDALTAVGLKTPEQKKVSEIRVKLQELARRLAAHDLSPSATQELHALAQAVQVNDLTAAQRHHFNLVKTDWANNNEWLLALKMMLLMAKRYLENSG